MNINTTVAFVLNNLFVVAAGGLVAAWLGWRMWCKVEGLVSRFQSWQDLAFWAVKLVIVVAVLFRVGAWIFSNVNTAIVAAVNSPSIQQSGQALVDMGAAIDQKIGWAPSPSSSGGMLASDLQIGGAVNLLSSIAPAVEAVVEVVEMPNTFVAPDGSVQTVSPPDPSAVQLLPLNQMFQAATAQTQAAAVNASIGAPAAGPVGNYIVQPGDSLVKIAQRLGIDAGALCRANGLPNCNVIRTGQTLVMPGSVAKALNKTVAEQTSNKINAPRYTGNQTVYTQPKLNQSYIPQSWNVLEQGNMSVGEPASMSVGEPASSEVFASFSTK